MSLTINQEKQIRAQRETKNTIKSLRTVAAEKLALYEKLARNVFNYRRSQKLTGPGSTDLRRDLLNEIDRCLEDLGL